jgi:hypothetical protein
MFLWSPPFLPARVTRWQTVLAAFLSSRVAGSFNAIFYVLAGLGLLGLLLTLLVPTGRHELHSILIEPTRVEPTPHAVKS